MQAGRQAGLLWWSSGVGVRAWSKLFIGRSVGLLFTLTTFMDLFIIIISLIKRL